MCYLASLNLILPLSANPANGETQPNFVNFEEVIADWVGVEFYRIISNKNFYFWLFQTVVSIFPWFSISDEPASQKIKKSGSGEKKVVNSKENALESRERFVNTYEKRLRFVTVSGSCIQHKTEEERQSSPSFSTYKLSRIN